MAPGRDTGRRHSKPEVQLRRPAHRAAVRRVLQRLRTARELRWLRNRSSSPRFRRASSARPAGTVGRVLVHVAPRLAHAGHGRRLPRLRRLARDGPRHSVGGRVPVARRHRAGHGRRPVARLAALDRAVPDRDTGRGPRVQGLRPPPPVLVSGEGRRRLPARALGQVRRQRPARRTALDRPDGRRRGLRPDRVRTARPATDRVRRPDPSARRACSPTCATTSTRTSNDPNKWAIPYVDALPASSPRKADAIGRRFLQAEWFHHRGRREEWRATRRATAARVFEPDFHKIVTLVARYPKLMRLLGLVFELEFPLARTLSSPDTQVQVTARPRRRTRARDTSRCRRARTARSAARRSTSTRSTTRRTTRWRATTSRSGTPPRTS